MTNWKILCKIFGHKIKREYATIPRTNQKMMLPIKLPTKCERCNYYFLGNKDVKKAMNENQPKKKMVVNRYMVENNNSYSLQIMMNLQIRLQALESFVSSEKRHKTLIDYPSLTNLFCPRCLSFDFKGGSNTDENDTYLVMKCSKCAFQYSPSHSSP